MPSNDDAKGSGDRLDRFLIDGPTADAPGEVAGLDAFLAAPPLPAEPAPPPPAASPRAAVLSHDMNIFQDSATVEPHPFPDATLDAAALPILESFPPEPVEAPAVRLAFGDDDDDSLIAPPSFDLAGAADPTPASAAPPGPAFPDWIERGGGDGVLSALAASPLDDRMLADPPAPLSAVPWSSPAAVEPAGDRFDPWSADASPARPPAALARFGPSAPDSWPPTTGAGESWPRGDERSSADLDALDRLEGRLSRALARLEEAVSALSAPGPSPLGSRPRGFKGRIDA